MPGHIMARCLSLANNRLASNEDKANRLSIKGKQIENLKRPSFATMLINLRRVPMGQFLRNAVKEMEQLPFVLTRDGNAIAIIGPFKEGEV